MAIVTQNSEILKHQTRDYKDPSVILRTWYTIDGIEASKGEVLDAMKAQRDCTLPFDTATRKQLPINNV